MAEYIFMYENCRSCVDGIVPTHTHNEDGTVTKHMTEPCTRCGESGWRMVNRIDVTEIVDMLTDIRDKCEDIKEKVDELE